MAKTHAVQAALDAADRTWLGLQRIVDGKKKLRELIGKHAAPLQIEAWVNGTPLTVAELQGKVILLHFWAVWCGACIEMLPHLHEWETRFGDKGLVIVGLATCFRGHSSPNQGIKTPESERESVTKFAQDRGVTHRLAIDEGEALTKFYGVLAIPHVVIIDQHGEIRLMSVGANDWNIKDIDSVLYELLGDR